MRENKAYQLIAALYLAFVACGWVGRLWALALLPVTTWLFYLGLSRVELKPVAFPCTCRNAGLPRLKAYSVSAILFAAVMALFALDRTVSIGWDFRMDDAFCCWQDGGSGTYTNWHPALYTFLFFGVPHFFFENMNAAIVTHMASLAVGIALVGYALLREGVDRRWTVGIVLLMACNPFTLLQVLKPVKDVAFSAGFLASLACITRIVFSDGRWLDKKWHAVMTAFVLAITLILRHNAMFVVVPLLIMVLWVYGTRVRVVWLLTAFALTAGCIYGPFYQHVLHVTKESEQERHRHLLWESCGLPISMMGAVYQAHAEQIPAENKAWMECILPAKLWHERYFHCFNSVKFGGYITAAVAPSWPQFWADFSACVKADPELAWRTFLIITSQVWNPVGSVDLSHAEELASRLQTLPAVICKVGESVLYVHFNCVIGFVMLALAVFLGLFPTRKTALIVLPVMAYNLGTMLLLSGNDARFFFYCVVSSPILIVLLAFVNSARRDDVNVE